MKQPKTSLFRRFAGLCAALFAAPALAATSAPVPVASEAAQWVLQHTDITASQVAIAGPKIVYSLETLGPRLATGEVIALVRTEHVADRSGATAGFHSWDAHVLVDCNGRRMRVIRSASYSAPNRTGTATSERQDEGWLSPEPSEPAARLLAAACDADYAWPLRAHAVVASAPSRPDVPAVRPPTPVARAPAVQLAYGPFEQGAQRALSKARTALGASAAHLTATTEASGRADRRRYVALLTGFSTAQAAKEACATLARAGQPCLLRRPPEAAPAELREAPSADAILAATTPPAGYAVQVAYGPSEDGARRDLQRARTALGGGPEGISASIEVARRRGRPRYMAVLAGLPSRREAARVCRTLATAGQSCLTRLG